MTLRIPAASIPPDLRFGAADALADPSTSVTIGDMTPHAQGCLRPWPDFPPYLRYADRETIVIAEGVDRLADLEACLARVIRAGARQHLLAAAASSSTATRPPS